jgi:hypothetical protein
MGNPDTKCKEVNALTYSHTFRSIWHSIWLDGHKCSTVYWRNHGMSHEVYTRFTKTHYYYLATTLGKFSSTFFTELVLVVILVLT